MKSTTIRAAAAALGLALAVPAVAGAHPGIYTQTVTIVRSGAPSPPTSADLITRIEYYVQNDGRSIILQENNGVTDTAHPAVPANGFQPAVPATVAGGGMTNFKQFPGAFRGNTSLFPDKASWLGYAPAHSDVQLHATCLNVPALANANNIVSWQSDPFYQYIPWQATSAGLGDDPSRWIPLVQSLTGVNLAALSTPAQFSSACSGIGGTYYPADGVITTPASAASASVADAVAPIQAAKDDSDKAAAAALAAQKTAENAAAAAQAAATAAQTELQRLQLAATPLHLGITPGGSIATLTKTGQTATVSGGPLALVTVRLLTTELTARKLGLTSRVLATRAITFGANGTATATIKPAAALAARLRRLKALPLTIDASSSQRTVSVTSVLR